MSLSYGFALQSTDNSADFASALYNVVGDGVAQYGGRFSLTVNGFSVTVASGYAFATGRWIENDEPLVLRADPPGNADDRTDALVARVDYVNRVVNLEVLTDFSEATRDENEYVIVLYLIRVRRGATSITPSDITDVRANKEMCGTVFPLSSIAMDVLKVYQFLTSGIDEKVNRLTELSDAVIAKADVEIAKLNKEIARVSGAAQIGEMVTARNTPQPEDEWLLCSGGKVPSHYPKLSAMLGGNLPNLLKPDSRYRTYIYGGAASNN